MPDSVGTKLSSELQEKAIRESLAKLNEEVSYFLDLFLRLLT